ncbi:MAG: porin family protein [Methylococcales bacterium]|nr:porin family protein [Methylococcales bacterium]
MTFKKTNLCLGIALATMTMAGALVSPQALARTSAERMAEAANNKADALEAQLQALQAEVISLREQANRPAASADSEKVQELDAWMTSVKSEPVKAKEKNNMVFFRGGYSHNNHGRGGTLDPTYLPIAGGISNPNGLAVGEIADQDAWYFGAGFDFSLNDDLFGLMDGTEVLAELMFDYKELGTKQANGLSPQEVAVVNSLGFNLPPANSETATVNQLSLAASPKIKFLKGHAFRPWLIPIGFELSIISPPSDAITVLTPGMQFGLGADYKIWNNLYVGADARYHYAPGDVDGVNPNGVTAGGYLGIGF